MRLTLAATLFALLTSVSAHSQTGREVPSLAAYDQFMSSFLRQHNVPGAALAVARGGKLVFARGYGFADLESQTPVQPDSLFRVASLSKPVAAVATLKLVEQGQLRLDQSAFDLLGDLQPPPGFPEDPRLKDITIRHLLEHSGGWDKEQTFDPMHQSPYISAALGVPAPASTENIIRAMRTQPLQFDPGTRHAYSNLGYAVLARLIDRVTGMSYEQYVRTRILAPLGISRMRVGNTLASGRLQGEVKYYYGESGPSVFPDTPAVLPFQYGGSWAMEQEDGPGSWIASVIDYSKFLNGIDGLRGNRTLQNETLAAMTARPGIPEWANAVAYYGLGFMVRPVGSRATLWHWGGTDGSLALAVRTFVGDTWVVFLNASPVSEQERAVWLDELDRGLSQAFSSVRSWPSDDLYVDYPDVSPQTFTALPAIATRDGVVNAASGERGIVAGSWMSISGVNLSPTTRAWNAGDYAGDRLPQSLDGVSVTVNGLPAAVYFISPTQIIAQAPGEVAAGWVPVEVRREGVGSGTVLAHARLIAPGVFTHRAGGRVNALATTADSTPIANPEVTPGVQAARPGETIVIYATGLAPSPAGVLVRTPLAINGVAVTIGGVNAAVRFAGVVSAGLFQINAVVPNVGDGYQSLTITVNGASSADGVSLFVRR